MNEVQQLLQDVANIRFLCIGNLFLALAALMVAIGNRKDPPTKGGPPNGT